MSKDDHEVRARSPSFPYISLKEAIGRAEKMMEKHKNYETSPSVVANTWGFGAKSSTLAQTIATLLSFGLIESLGKGKERKVKITDLTRKIITDRRPGVKEAAIKESALKPKIMEEYARKWKTGRPIDDHCISELEMDRGFTPSAARRFLRIFDSSLRYAKIEADDMIPMDDLGENTDKKEGRDSTLTHPASPTQSLLPADEPVSHSASTSKGFFSSSGFLTSNANFRLVIEGEKVGPQEIERLIKKLAVDKEAFGGDKDNKKDGK